MISPTADSPVDIFLTEGRISASKNPCAGIIPDYCVWGEWTEECENYQEEC